MSDAFAKIAEGYSVDLSRGLVCPQPVGMAGPQGDFVFLFQG